MRAFGRPGWRRSERRQVDNDDPHLADDHLGSAFDDHARAQHHDDSANDAYHWAPEHAHDDSANDAHHGAQEHAHHGAQEHAHHRLYDTDDGARDHNDGLQLHAVRARDLLLGAPHELRDLGTERITRD